MFESRASHTSRPRPCAHLRREPDGDAGRHRCDHPVVMPMNHVVPLVHPKRRRRRHFQCAATTVPHQFTIHSAHKLVMRRFSATVEVCQVAYTGIAARLGQPTIRACVCCRKSPMMSISRVRRRKVRRATEDPTAWDFGKARIATDHDAWMVRLASMSTSMCVLKRRLMRCRVQRSQ